MDLRKLIEEYLKEAKLMQLATSVNDQPWVCSVWFGADEDLNIYWFSSTTRRHSHEVIKNNKVSAAIVLPHTPQDPVRGLQLQGTAEILTDQKEVDRAISVIKDRAFTGEKIKELMTTKAHFFFRIKPTQIVLFDVVNFPDNPRQEYMI